MGEGSEEVVGVEIEWNGMGWNAWYICFYEMVELLDADG